MGIRGSWATALCTAAIAAACLTGCSSKAEKPSQEVQRVAHLDRVRETYRLGRREGLAMQRQKIASGAAPSYSSPSEKECADRWDQLGEHEQSAGDRVGFLSACSSFPAPGMPGYDEAVAEVAGKRP
ncbi:glutamine synthetase [Streptomyces lydicamycinicus]|uniref:Glutamine synthetase n=1 Tax=Streptomyces lydicamycinicus TaxID=1546107 RepID=A0A0P4R783_9ACTN|nr:glutamine synthetase [Streptomyces lydicamycinicus]